MKRYVYISAADFGLVNYLLQGYYEGKVLFCPVFLCLVPEKSSNMKKMERCAYFYLYNLNEKVS